MIRLPSSLRPLWPYLKPVYTKATWAVAPFSMAVSAIRGGQLPSRVVSTLEEAAATSGGQCVVARPPEQITRRVPIGLPPDHPVFEENLVETVPRVAVAELPGGRVLAPHSALITANGALVHELSIYFGTSRPREHPLFLHPFPGPPVEVEGRLGVLAMQGDANFYHFMMDVLPRIGVLEQAPEIAPPDRWYVPAATAFQRELLEMVGIGPDDRIDSTQVPHVRGECLVVPCPPSMTVRNPPWVGEFLRTKLLGPGPRQPKRRLYVTRGAARNNRSVVNESEVVGLLEPMGFEVIDPVNMTVSDQIRAFSESRIVVAPHGAALAHLVFAPPGAAVVELFAAGCIVPDYWKMAGGVPGLEYRYLLGRGDERPRGRSQLLIRDIVVDLTKLRSMLATVGVS